MKHKTIKWRGSISRLENQFCKTLRQAALDYAADRGWTLVSLRRERVGTSNIVTTVFAYA